VWRTRPSAATPVMLKVCNEECFGEPFLRGVTRGRNRRERGSLGSSSFVNISPDGGEHVTVLEALQAAALIGRYAAVVPVPEISHRACSDASLGELRSSCHCNELAHPYPHPLNVSKPPPWPQACVVSAGLCLDRAVAGLREQVILAGMVSGS
jgi:hypothetical protein